jgi:hypothetical protein
VSVSRAERLQRQINWYNRYLEATREANDLSRALVMVRQTLAKAEEDRERFRRELIQANIKIGKVKELVK